MLQINEVELLGYAGAKPRTGTTTAGTGWAGFSLCTTARYRNRDGDTAERSEWHRIVAFGPQAAVVARMVRKGDPVMVRGRLQYRDYEDGDGENRKVTEIVVGGRDGMINVLAPGRTDHGEIAPDHAAPETPDDIPF